jgi:hypothetical protein
MEIVKACVTAVHPDLNVVVFEAVCLDGGLISEHRAVQEGGGHCAAIPTSQPQPAGA